MQICSPFNTYHGLKAGFTASKIIPPFPLWFEMRYLLCLFGLACALSASAAPPSNSDFLPNYDLRRAPAANAAQGQARTAIAATTNSVPANPNLRIDKDPLLGFPSWVTPRHGFLTAPTNHAQAAIAGNSLTAPDPYQPVKQFLNDNAAALGHGAEILQSAQIVQEYTMPQSGLHTIVWEQNLNGVSVYKGRLVGHLTKNGELINLSSTMVPAPVQAALARHMGFLAAPVTTPVSAGRAVSLAAQDIGEKVAENSAAPDAAPEGADWRQTFTVSARKGKIGAHLVWLPTKPGEMRLCWEVRLTSAQDHGTYMC